MLIPEEFKIFECEIEESIANSVWRPVRNSRWASAKQDLSEYCMSVFSENDIVFANWVILLKEVKI